ncbi:MAG: response regulator transcription factor [Holophaga sp.]|nr:response regulator transcription factor [Holophaga sp.]
MISVLIADDQRMFCQGLVRLFSDDRRFRPVHVAGNGLEALAGIVRFRPDVAVLALTMQGLSGFEVTTRVIADQLPTRCIILALRGEHACIPKLLAEGARGCLFKDAAFEELADLAQRVAADRPDAAEAGRAPGLKPGHAFELSKRELEVLRLVARGLTSKQIARAMFISPYTVDSHRQRIMQKLSISNGPGLVRYALCHGIT